MHQADDPLEWPRYEQSEDRINRSPQRLGDSVMIQDIKGRIDNIQKVTHLRREEARRQMVSCVSGSESCKNRGVMTGRVVVEGSSFDCERLIADPTGCAFGLQRYYDACQVYLGSIGKSAIPLACFHHPDFVTDELSAVALKYADRNLFDQHVSLLFGGPTGSGKTVACLALMAHLAVTRHIKTKALQAHIAFSRGFWTEDLDDAVSVPLLLIDDIGIESKTEAVQANMTTVIDQRMGFGRPTFITTNLPSVEKFLERYGDRIGDRLKQFESYFLDLPSKR